MPKACGSGDCISCGRRSHSQLMNDNGGNSALKLIVEKTKLKVPVITYHSIDNSGSVISTSPVVFRRQMKHLADGGHCVVSLGELVGSFKTGTRLPAKPVVLTFDDGFGNFYTEAFPVLSEYGLLRYVFLVTDYCGKVNDWPGNSDEIPRSKLLSWHEVRELDRHGIEIGSHTMTHPDLTRLTANEIEQEIIGSQTEIEDAVGRKAATFAYPFGWKNEMVKRIVANIFDAACSTELGKVSAASDFYSLCRLDSYYLSNQRLFEMHSSAIFDNYMRFRQALRSVRHSFRRA